MKYEAIIRYTINDVIDYAKKEGIQELKAVELTTVLHYIEDKHDCGMSYWDNIGNAIIHIRS